MTAASIASLVVGTALLAFTVVDIFVTVFVIGGGAGPQSNLIASRAWRVALRLHDPTSATSHSRMRAAGPLIVLAILVAWVVELSIAWALIFVPEAFASDGVGFDDRLVFAGTSIVGRGGNDPALSPLDGTWDLLESLAGLTGVTFVSLALAYVLPVLAAVAHKRSVAATVNTLGSSVGEMRDLIARTEGGGQFELHLIAIGPQIAYTAERHRAYPVLHYFHSATPYGALAPAVAKLAVLLDEGMPDAPKVDATVVVPLERALHDLVGALCDMGLTEHVRRREGVDLAEIEPVGIAQLEQGVEGGPSLRWMRAYLAFDGWEWDVVDDEDADEG